MSDSITQPRFGVDLGGTAIKLGRVEGEELVQRLEIDTPHEGEACLDAIATALRELAAGDPIASVGIGLPGVVDLERRCVIEAPNLEFLGGLPTADMLSERLGCPVLLENDANAAAFGEAQVGAGRGFSDFLFLTLGTGVGGGVILDGLPFHGPGGMAGEIGHITTGHDRQCGCGTIGCLEAIASARAMETLAAQELGRALSLEEMAKAARKGDKDALSVFRTSGIALGIALAQVALLLDLRIFLVGGGGAPTLDLLAPHALDQLEKRCFGRTASDFKLTQASLGNDAGIHGAARLS
ncbi:MAG: ROK family protein [Planctomycetota bacterium]|jgi:glucokinase|nr:ROK family protein [Planctomycetota bacterium]